ncbi:MAG TPA: cupredoxin domain-containing protein [Candidatus Solibacter sp.]|jgi:plastocyanin|nr:cupredoxin domain-containing protein [Candidatus Solibacter sp.]
MSLRRLLGGLGVAVTVVAMAACGSSSSTDNGGGTGGSPLPAAAVTIAVEYDAANAGKYVPTPTSAKVGDVVQWSFNDDQNGPHTVTSDDGSTFDSQAKGVAGNKGDKFQFTFTKAGTYAYHCTYHANMHGTITVQ